MVSTLSIYRKWRIEQEIEGLLWKIDPEDLLDPQDLMSSPSKVQLGLFNLYLRVSFFFLLLLDI